MNEKKYQAYFYPRPGKPWIKPRYRYDIEEYEFWVYGVKGRLVSVEESMHDAEKKCEELENGNTVEQSL